MEKISGINFIDKFIEQKGLPWCIRGTGYLGIVSGVLSLIMLVTFPLWKEQILAKWQSDNLPLLLPLYNNYKHIVLAPLIIIAGVGLLKFRQWGRMLSIFISVYNIFELIAILIYRILVISPRCNKLNIVNLLFATIVVLYIVFIGLRILIHPKVKDQFK